MNLRRLLSVFVPCLVVGGLVTGALAASAQAPAVILHAPEATKLLPDAVYYAGKSANTQLRNSAGIHFGDGHYTLAVLVDTSGYSSTIQEKYQGYLLSEVPLEIEGHPLLPGAWGMGFVGDHFVVTDIGSHDIFEAPATHDAQMLRPVPLEIREGDAPGRYRLCFGRNCVRFHRAQ
jgi:hypothetical protein